VIAEAVELGMYAYDNFTYNVEQIRVPEGKHLLEVHLEGQVTITANPWAEVVQGSWLDGATFGPGGLLPPPAYGYPNLLATWVYYKPDNTDEYRLMYVSPRSARGTTQPLSFEYFTESPGEVIVYRNAAPLLPYQYLTLTGRHTVTVYATPLMESGELSVSCSPNKVLRGARVECTAAVDGDDADWQVANWLFEADGVRITPAGYTQKTWAGIMVRGGTVTVTAVVGGETKTARTQVTVDERTDWAGRMPYPAAEPRPQLDVNLEADWPPMPVRDSAGYVVWVAGGFGQYTFGIDWQGHLTSVGSGPNANFWYFADPPGWLEPKVWISPFLDPAHPFYASQHARQARERAPQRYQDYCSSTNMQAIAREVVAHEGQVGGPRISHHEHKIVYVAQHDPGPAVERVVFYAAASTVSMNDVVGAELDKAYVDALRTDDKAVVHASSNLFTPTCKLRY
jgi:hypothetical protein